ncbi:MAG: ABC transporter ATP-binding protein [Waddliaceae bacterium]
MKKPVISLKNVSFSYQDTPILENVDAEIFSGEFIGIFGPNGGGKTTLLKLIMGLLPPTSGVIETFGAPQKERPQAIAYVPQRHPFDPDFPISVLELVLLGRLSRLPWYGKFHADDVAAAVDQLEKVGLSHTLYHSFGTLSGGQAQRALIARALVSEPELLLLDEPTSGVDFEAEEEIFTLLEELKGKITIVIVTHHLRTAIDQVHRVFCIKKNVISLDPEEVCEHFAMGLYHPPLIKGKEK